MDVIERVVGVMQVIGGRVHVVKSQASLKRECVFKHPFIFSGRCLVISFLVSFAVFQFLVLRNVVLSAVVFFKPDLCHLRVVEYYLCRLPNRWICRHWVEQLLSTETNFLRRLLG